MAQGETPQSSTLSQDDAERVNECVESFARAWDDALVARDSTDSASFLLPDLSKYLPESDSECFRVALRALVRIDLEHRWENRRHPLHLEQYLSEYPALAHELKGELVYEEFRSRRQSGEIVSKDEYRRRFPQLTEELELLWSSRDLSESSTDASTIIFGKQLEEPPVEDLRDRRPVDLADGEILDDFLVLRKLGQGTFGAVYLAMQQSMQRLVALKASPDRGDEPRTLAQLDHEHIVRVFDQRMVPERGIRLLYMQYISGGTLADVVKCVEQTPLEMRSGELLFRVVDRAAHAHGESLPEASSLRTQLSNASWPEVVCWIGARLSAALDYAHRNGVIHRDLKPANVLLTFEGVPKLVDFNISFSSQVQGATPNASFGGSLAYMSPEQLEAASPRHERQPQDLDGRSDLYSLAILLCELLTGRRPFTEEPQKGTLSQLIDGLLDQRRQLAITAEFEGEESWPEGMGDTLRRCLSPIPADRPRDAAELSRTFELCLRPRARRLLYPQSSIINWIVRHPLFSLVVSAAFPNFVFFLFNIYYNQTEVLHRHPDLRKDLGMIQNSLITWTIPPAMAAIVWYAWTIAQAVKNRDTPRHRLVAIRRRCAHFGQTVALLSLMVWILTGIAFAIMAGLRLTSLAEQAQMTMSLILRGLMAAVYPFFPTTFVALRFMYPRLVRLSTMGESDQLDLHRLRQRVVIYQFLAAIVPMVTLGLLVLTDAPSALILSLMVIRSGVSFAIVLLFSRFIMDDISALRYTIRSRRWPD